MFEEYQYTREMSPCEKTSIFLEKIDKKKNNLKNDFLLKRLQTNVWVVKQHMYLLLCRVLFFKHIANIIHGNISHNHKHTKADPKKQCI